MKQCPNCRELVGDNVGKCFNCGYDWENPEANKLAEQRQRERELAREQREREAAQREREAAQRERERKVKEREEAIKKAVAQKEEIFAVNNLYEYRVETVSDLDSGSSNRPLMAEILSMYAQEGWRLHSIYTNEVGRTSHPQVLGVATINATIDQTVMVFERIVARAGQKNN